MKERPIIMSAPMVRAILDGRKTQTRRVIKPQPTVSEQRLRELGAWAEGFTLSEQVNAAFQAGCVDATCPYGRPGDRLWVREAFIPAPMESVPSEPKETRWHLAYAAGGDAEANAPAGYNPTLYNYERWTSPIHMPRWASRITLEVTGVRVERLQDISEDDARAEGLRTSLAMWIPASSPRLEFRTLWESINGPGSWSATPWVWVIEFARIDAQQAAA